MAAEFDSSYGSQASQGTRNSKSFVRRSVKTIWSSEEDAIVTREMRGENRGNWRYIADLVPPKTSAQVSRRWGMVLNPLIMKGSWTVQEDRVILDWVGSYGANDWARLATILKERTGKQCRERWINYLSPERGSKQWTHQEDIEIVQLRSTMGNRWKAIADRLPGRNENQVKNRWYSTIARRIERVKRGEPIELRRGRKPTMNKPTRSQNEVSLFEEGSIQPESVSLCHELFEYEPTFQGGTDTTLVASPTSLTLTLMESDRYNELYECDIWNTNLALNNSGVMPASDSTSDTCGIEFTLRDPT